MRNRAGARLFSLLILLHILLGVLPAQAQTPLTLKQAVTIALEKNPARKIALADQKVAAAGVKEARAALLPRLTFSESAMRGNDPVYVFGSRLRQQRFTSADFALNRLNRPTPFGDFTTRLGGNWNLFDSFANVLNVRRAQDMQTAAAQQLARTDQELVFRVVQAYYGLLLAAKQQDVAEQAMRTADSILETAKNRFQAGLVVEADYLSAQVNAAQRQQELIRARNDVALARVQLNNALGVPADSAYEPAAVLAERALPLSPLPDLEKQALETRPDLKQVKSQQAAQDKGAAAAKASFGPRLNAFASWEADNPAFTGGGGNNWVGGLELQLDLFSGGQKQARLERERAMQDRIAAMRQMAEDGIRLDVRRAYYDTDAARQQVEVARVSQQQAAESLRINQNRYESGLATITDLLRVEDAARRSQTDYWQSLYRYQTSFANLELATGTLNPQSPVVTP
jgi:outer membrane protein TolC